MMRRTVLGLVGGMIAALLCFAPAVADEASPQTSTRADGNETYRDPSLASEPTQRVEGVLRKVVADSAAGSTESTIIVTDDNIVVPVDFDAAVATDVPVTAHLLEGPKLDAALDGRSTSPVEVASANLERAVASAAGIAHRAYLAIITDSGPLAATSTLQARVDDGLAYWQTEAGASIPTFNRSGSVAYDSALTGAERCGVSSPDALWTEAAGQFPGVDFSAGGNHLIVVVSDECSDYGTGIGTVGSSINSGGLTAMTQDSTIFKSTMSHELGHNFGLEHANFCAPSCGSPTEYWNLYSVMGLAVSDSAEFGPPALDSAYRDQLGITVPGETQTVSVGESLTTDISPRGASAGLRGVEVLVGGTSFWVDYRNGSGLDSSTFYAANGEIGGRSFPGGVTVTRQATDSQAATALMASTASIGSYGLGQSFSAGGVTVTVNSVGPAANVTISQIALPPVGSSTPTISGSVKVGRTAMAAVGSWTSGTSFAYQWTANGVNIAGATNRTYTIPGKLRGKLLAVNVTGSKAGSSPVRKASAGKSVAAGTLAAPRPKISGKAKVGKKLIVRKGKWTWGTSFTYRWYANGRAISKATGTTYKIAKKYKGKKITVKVTGKKTGYTTVTKTSATTKKVAK